MNEKQTTEHKERMLDFCRRGYASVRLDELNDLINRMQEEIAKTPPPMRARSSHCRLMLEAINMLRRLEQ